MGVYTSGFFTKPCMHSCSSSFPVHAHNPSLRCQYSCLLRRGLAILIAPQALLDKAPSTLDQLCTALSLQNRAVRELAGADFVDRLDLNVLVAFLTLRFLCTTASCNVPATFMRYECAESETRRFLGYLRATGFQSTFRIAPGPGPGTLWSQDSA